ncbi:phytanoyl-CoA dioxygenase family protein [Fluviispira sanaruensis]|uniref:Phytanoyl-CoA dioxygenase family protein n=1 Tax=Fluviispira sanaruensis TaxID=2493639 RepID=A0A4P2VMQ9_FLUSA|nr:phytanoyl-CoA dioxygenase family protein [Fluviispira sanaruensis]BBH54078.1 phytanoyl-CoA dioxygenase family protein [Fluviispira sanaruensis]
MDSKKEIINSVHKLHINPYFNNILVSEKMKNIASFFLEENSVARVSEMFAKPADKGLASPIHQDNFYWCLVLANALTICLAVDPCSRENGVVSYMRGSRKLGLLPHVNSYAPGSSQTVERKSIPTNLEPVSEILNSGDVLIHHSLTIHWSAANTSGKSRLAMTLQYQGESVRIDPEMLKHYESNLLMQVNMREINTASNEKNS